MHRPIDQGPAPSAGPDKRSIRGADQGDDEVHKIQMFAGLSVVTFSVIAAWLASNAILQAESEWHLAAKTAAGAPAAASAVSCRQGSKILRRDGFQSIKAFDCTGPGYRYFARKDNQQRVILMNAQNAAYLVAD